MSLVLEEPLPSKNNHKRFERDLYFFSYILHKSHEIGKKPITITNFAKLIANVIQDLRTVSVQHYSPIFRIKPNLFGMVPYSPEYVVSTNSVPLYKFDGMCQNKGLWCIEERVKNKFIIPLMSSDEIKKLILNQDPSTNFDFNFIPFHLGIADCLIKMYSNLTTIQLNILASHRTPENSMSCLGFEFRKWATLYKEIIDAANQETSILTSNIAQMVKVCNQIEIKTEYSLKEIGKIIELIQNKESNLEELEKTLFESILSSLKKDSVVTESQRTVIEEQYCFNRKYLVPITQSLMTYFECNSLFSFSEGLNCTNDPSILPSEIIPESIEIPGNFNDLLSNISQIYLKALNGGGRDILRPFKPRGDRHNEDWIEVGDGNEE